MGRKRRVEKRKKNYGRLRGPRKYYLRGISRLPIVLKDFYEILYFSYPLNIWQNNVCNGRTIKSY